MKRVSKKFLIALGIAAVLLIMLIFISKHFAEKKDNSCETDSDCVKVDAGCCGCNEGGEAIAIHKNEKDSWESQLQKNCTDVFCTQVISNHPSCEKEAVCINDECVLE